MDSVSATVFALLPITLLGSILNWSVFYSIHKLSSFNNSFGFLSANQAFSDALHSTTFLLYFCPMAFFNEPHMKHFSHYCGFLLLFCYELSVMTHFTISINRFFAAWAPFYYEKMFSLKSTRMILVILWVYTGSVAWLFYQYFCHLYYDEETHFFTFTKTEFCGQIGWYGDFLKNAAFVAIIVGLDVLTVLRVRHMTKKVSTSMSEDTQHNFTARDIRFLKQTVFQGSVFMLELLTYFFFPIYFKNQWIVFLGTSFAWVAVHAADGMVVIVCNPEIRRFLMCKKPMHQVSVTRSFNTQNL
uniref:7TM_GPCR_Srx domain-containing protein n=2 Tax=Caenorhabditis tropicalis TaxID=1561998 RepID=A0A1I7TXV5_9PELO